MADESSGSDYSKSSKKPKNESSPKDHCKEFASGESTACTPSTSTKKQDEQVLDFTLLKQAERILESARSRYGNRIHQAYGALVDQDYIREVFDKWIRRNSVTKTSMSKEIKSTGVPELEFSDQILCSAKLVTSGPTRKTNKPENRKYKLVIRTSDDQDNLFVRENSITSLLDHELGTHYLRHMNEGMQPWYFDRTKFGLCSPGRRELLEIEEGLASIHTAFNMPLSQLWFPAILYVTGCYHEMNNYNSAPTVRQLQRFCDNAEFCQRLTRRAANKLGPHDQAYLIGALEILKDRHNIDFPLLMSGKLLPSELKRVRRIVRRCSVKIPHFMNDNFAYMRRLDQIAAANFVD